MREEAKELYIYTKNTFEEDLKRISPTCISPIIAVRRVVKNAIEKYCKDYCTQGSNPFSEEDFQEVSQKIRSEIMNEEL